MLKIARASGLIAFQHQRSGLGWPGTSKSIYCACHTFCRRFGHDARALTADNDSCVCKRTVYTPFWRLPRDLRQFSDPTEWWKRHENKISLTFWVTKSEISQPKRRRFRGCRPECISWNCLPHQSLVSKLTFLQKCQAPLCTSEPRAVLAPNDWVLNMYVMCCASFPHACWCLSRREKTLIQLCIQPILLFNLDSEQVLWLFFCF